MDNKLLKIQLKQESDKLSGTGRGKLFESALERIEELEAQQSEVAARAVEEFTKYCTDEIARLYGWEGAVIEAEAVIKGLVLTASQRYPDKEDL